jgi:acyl-CoA synthetase (AMP-forming)/AMP-acid ligase II
VLTPARGPFADVLRGHGDRVALVTDAGTITYDDLANRVDEARERLGPRRRLILLAARNDPEAVVLYLAALRGRHPLILVDADNREAITSIAAAYDPDVVAGPSRNGGAWEILERRTRPGHVLHPDLALLLSTSGSTGSPKLVRLSLANLAANAESIATYLGLGADDRAITTLPLSYCYGMSVLNSHLQRGASVVLTTRSVIEPEFWELLKRSGATSLAGVPYTFDLLDRVGFADMTLPSLRQVTQAGGRLDPARVRRFAELGQRSGWELFVMYGQTEATARMTYLPPALATSRPASIGVPVPGGSLHLDPVPGAPADTGELVYRGPNVMLGYAHGHADLALGPTLDELRTGDLGRRGPDGLYEIVGRTGEFLKIAGLRVDLHGVERLVERHGGRACAVGTDEQLVVFTEPDAPANLHARIREAICLPASAVHVAVVPELSRLPNGKVNRRAMQERAASLEPAESLPEARVDGVAALRQLYVSALGRGAIGDDDSFAGLGGDSLSYVEITLGIEEILGRLPEGWATMSIRQLGALGASTRPRAGWWQSLAQGRSIETSVALRALAIVLIVATHIGMIAAPGGAHVLMAVAGFNFGRFRLSSADRSTRLRSQLRAVARIALPAMAWVAVVMLLTDQYEIRHLLLVNALVKDELWGNLWFIELLVYIGLGMAALMAVPAMDRAERRWPFGVALAALAVGLLFRFGVLDFGIPYTMPVLWLFAMGWAASRADRGWQRALVLAVALLAVPGYFDSLERNAAILVGIVLLVGVPRIRVPGAVARAAGVLAGASLYVYLVHWEVWPLFEGWYGLPSLVASLAGGIALWLVASRLPGTASRLWGWVGRRVSIAPAVWARPSPSRTR